MVEPGTPSRMVVFFNTTTGQITRYGVMDPGLNGREGEDHILVPVMTDCTGMMVDVAARVLVALPADRPKTESEIAAEWYRVRCQRDAMLAGTDYLMVEDAPVTPEDKVDVRAYRAALRDLTKTTTDPFAVVWPTLTL